jgi:type II secretory pathway component PulF
MYRLYADRLSKNGKRIPYLKKNDIRRIMKETQVEKRVMVLIHCIHSEYSRGEYIRDYNIPIKCEFDTHGSVFISFKSEQPLNDDGITKIIEKSVNPVIEEVASFIEQYGYSMNMFYSLYSKNVVIREIKYKTLLKLPLIGSIFSDLCVTRFARTLGTLLKSGVPMINSLEVARNVVNNALFEEAITASSVLVTEGKALNLALKQTQLFPPIIIHMVSVGEKTGDLENMLLNVADNYDQQIEARLGKLTSLLEPLMIVAMVLVVGFIVMAVLLPIFEMQNV